MRPLLVVVLAVVILSCMQLFMQLQSAGMGHTHEGPQLIQASGEFRAEVILTFDAGPDEFSLDNVADAASVLVQLAGMEILRETGVVRGDVPIVISLIEGLVPGKNEFYVQASPKDERQLYRAVGVRVFRDDTLLAEKTLLSEPGATVQGTITVEVPEAANP